MLRAVGILAALRLTNAIAADPGPAGQVHPELASPWSVGPELNKVLWADIWGLDTPYPPSRAEAMSIPALARSRNILTSTIARIPLEAYRLDVKVDPQPTWLYRTDQLQTPFSRMVWTVDDLFWYGESLWWVDGRTTEGFPIATTRVPWDDWEVDADRHILVAGREVAPDQVIYFDGFHEGVLAYGAAAIRSASQLEVAASETAKRPFRLELHQTTDEPLNREQRADLVAEARKALETPDGILYTNAAIEAKVHAFDSSQLLIEGRNASAVDMARLASLPATLIDANTAGSSLTYETSQGRNRQAVDYGFAAYMASISSRLSADDVVPRGQHVAFQLEDFTGPVPTITGTELED